MIQEFQEISAAMFCDFSAKYEDAWGSLKGVKVFHRDYGEGVILDVVLSKSDFPRITIRFDGVDTFKTWQPKSFENGKTVFFIANHVAERVDKYCEENESEAAVRKVNQERLLGMPSEQRKSEAHRISLEKLGIISKGIRRNSENATHFETHCWKPHHKELDSTVHYECLNCHRLICPCGACMCGRKLNFIANTNP